MCSARSGNGPTRMKTIDKQLKNESVKKEDAEFCGENLIVRKLNEPPRGKTNNGFRTGPTQTGLYKHRKELEA